MDTLTRDLFISHSSGDAEVARELRSLLEAAGYTCWMAPDDVTGTTPWAAQILLAIETSRAMLVLISSHSNQSTHVSREVELAASRGRAVFPIRVEDVPPAGALEYHIAGLQRIDAFPPPISQHLGRILRRLALTVPLAIEPPAAGPPAVAPSAAIAPPPPAVPPAIVWPPHVSAPPPTVLQSPTPAVVAASPAPPAARGLSAWARANSMLAGSIVTLVAIFVVATVAFALSAGKPGPSPTAAALASVAPTTMATEVSSLQPGESPPTEASQPSETAGSGGVFPSQAELDLFAAIPPFGKSVIADCARDTSGGDLPLAAITCDADNGELLFYERYGDLATQQSEYRSWVEVIMGNPIGSCASSDSGDAAWGSAAAGHGRLACYVATDGSAEFYWTDESRLLTVYWYGTTDRAPGSSRSLGYQLFLDWTAG